MVFKEGTNNYLEFEEMNGTKHKYELYIEKPGKLRQALWSMENRHIHYELNNKDF